MKASRIKAKLRRHEPVLLPMVHITDPAVYELASLLGFDGLWLDLEHHGTSLETASQLMRAARVGSADIMVRPAKGEFLRMSRCLEIGAQGIMYPRCDDAAEARQVVSWAKFAPLGRRGIDSTNADSPYGSLPLTEYIRRANDETFICIQVEDAAAVGQVDAIAAVDGVDVLFFGPGDFSIIEGIPGQYDHPRVQSAILAIAEAARKHGKHWGMPCWTPADAPKLLDLGARVLWCGTDLLLLKAGLIELRQQFNALGFTFDARL